MIRGEGGFVSMKLTGEHLSEPGPGESPIVLPHVIVLELTHIGEDQVAGREEPTLALQRCWCLTATIQVIWH